MSDGKKAWAEALDNCLMGNHYFIGGSCITCHCKPSTFKCLNCDGEGWLWKNFYESKPDCNDCNGKGFHYA